MNTKNKTKKNAFIWLLLSLVIVFPDQITKYFADKYLVLDQPVKIFPFFNLTLQYNPGAAFSFLGAAGGWQVYLLMAISIAVVIGVLFWLYRVPRSDWLLATSLSLILGGAIGNLIDRVRLGYVIDFCDFHIKTWHFATFNVADSAISVGAVLLVVKLLFVSEKC